MGKGIGDCYCYVMIFEGVGGVEVFYFEVDCVVCLFGEISCCDEGSIIFE